MVVIHLDHGRDGGGVALGYRDRVVGGGIAANILSTFYTRLTYITLILHTM